MIINCYQTTPANLIYTGCELARKAYESGNHCFIMAPTKEFVEEFDQTLWSYSRKYFVPHATSSDPLPTKQPIFISTEFGWQNQARILLLINPKRDTIIETSLEIKKEIKSIEKIIFLIEQDNELSLLNMRDILEKTYAAASEINFFQQKNNNSWQKLTSEYFKNFV